MKRFSDRVKRWRTGEERRLREHGAIRFRFHGFGCNMERCPHDGSQVLTCECEIEEVGS